VLGVPVHSPLYHAPVGTHLGTLKGRFARTCAAAAALADNQSAHALMRSCLGLAKVQYALRTLPLRHMCGLRGGRHCDTADHMSLYFS